MATSCFQVKVHGTRKGTRRGLTLAGELAADLIGQGTPGWYGWNRLARHSPLPRSPLRSISTTQYRCLDAVVKLGHPFAFVRPHERRHLQDSKGSDSMPPFSSPSMAWPLLLAAGLLEIVWSVCMKASDGFTKPMFTGITFIAAWLSFWLLGQAMKSLPVGTAYAVWTGIGAVGASALGIVLFKEPVMAARVACIAAIVGGILGLKFLPTAGAGTH